MKRIIPILIVFLLGFSYTAIAGKVPPTTVSTLKATDIIAKGPYIDARAYATPELAIAAGNLGGGKVRPVVFPYQTFTTTTPIVMYDGMTLVSWGGSNNEFDRRATIKNTTTNIFSFPGADVTDITLIGISFQGSSASMNTYAFDPQDTGTGYIIKYSKIRDCGFNWFAKAYSGRMLGTHFYENYVNHCIQGALTIAGSDNDVHHNILNAYQTVVANTVFVVELQSFSMSNFENNYITGWPAMPLKVSGGSGNSIERNRFDYSDGAAIYFVNHHGSTVANNTYRGNLAAPFAQYDGLNVLFDSYDINFHGNRFIGQPVGAKAFRFRKTTTGCYNITVGPNVYESPLVPAYTSDVDGITDLNWYEELGAEDVVTFGGVGIGVTARRQLSVGDYLDFYSGNAISPTVPSVRGNSSGNMTVNAHGAGNLYFNFDSGTGGVNFGNGAGGIVARVDSQGYLSVARLIATASVTPASNAACTAGTFYWDSNYMYICTASGVVKRAALTGGY